VRSLAQAGEQAAGQNVPLWRPRTEENAHAKAGHNGGYLRVAPTSAYYGL